MRTSREEQRARRKRLLALADEGLSSSQIGERLEMRREAVQLALYRAGYRWQPKEQRWRHVQELRAQRKKARKLAWLRKKQRAESTQH